MNRRYRIRRPRMPRIDLVDRGANQYADILITKSDPDPEVGDGSPSPAPLPSPTSISKKKTRHEELDQAEQFIRKHSSPTHPGTGSGQDVHGGKGRGGALNQDLLGDKARATVARRRGKKALAGAKLTGQGDMDDKKSALLIGQEAEKETITFSQDVGGDNPHGYRSLSDIAREIRSDWGAKTNYGAKPYLDAMRSLDKISDNYGYDRGDSVVAYFLSNASSWRGDTARRVKAELKAMLKNKPLPEAAKPKGQTQLPLNQDIADPADVKEMNTWRGSPHINRDAPVRQRSAAFKEGMNVESRRRSRPTVEEQSVRAQSSLEAAFSRKKKPRPRDTAVLRGLPREGQQIEEQRKKTRRKS